MADQPALDIEAAHKYFSTSCFNSAWELIEKPDRTPEDDEQMIRLTQTSLWHWMQRPDCTDKNLSIGLWQASRIYALLGQADKAREYAEFSLRKTPDNEDFYLGFAYEALARAESIARNPEKMKTYLAEAWRHAEAVTDDEERQTLTSDLRTLT